MRQKLLGTNNSAVGESLTCLADVLLAQKRFGEAESAIKEALAISATRLGSEDLAAAKLHTFLANALLNQAKPAEAETAVRKALAVQEALLGDYHADTIQSLAGLGQLFLKERRPDEMESLFRRIVTNAPDPFPTTPNLKADPVNALVNVLLTRHEFSLSEKMVTEVLTPAIEKHPRSVGLLLNRGTYFGRRGHWKEAALDFALALELDPSNRKTWSALSTLLVEIGDIQRYREYCDRLLFHMQVSTNRPLWEAKFFLLLPLDGDALKAVAKLGDNGVAATNSPMVPYTHLNQAVVEYRQGHLAEAERWLDRNLSSGYSDANLVAGNYVVRAMTRYQLKHFEAAHADLAKAREVTRTGWPPLASGELGRGWFDWLTVQIFLREAAQLIEGNASSSTGHAEERH